MTTRITTDNITDATIGTADLASSVPLNTQWQSVKTGNFTAVTGEGYFVDTTSTAITVTLPASPSAGDVVVLKDYARQWGTNAVTLASGLYDGVTTTATFDTQGQTVTLVYMDGTKGWSLVNEDTTSQLVIPGTFVAATGGTITTSGDYKIHTFTGDGCFVVSSIGNSCASPIGGPSEVDYLVVAGGGGGSSDWGGGAGAGGFRISNSTCMPAPTTSPLASSCGITVTAATYPITVGGGGSGGVGPTNGGGLGTNGSNSVFSTITSTGGGRSGNEGATKAGAPGGSGGGGGTAASPAGLGNTPPVSPPQGNNGGATAPTQTAGPTAGGGGAGAVGQDPPAGPSQTPGVPGGDGSYVSPTMAGCNGTTGPVPSVRYFAGGGGGMGNSGATNVYDNGGAGGGGGGACGLGPGPGGPEFGGGDGGVNTGGGGGGGGANEGPGDGGAGGKGIVIIRYKYQ